MTKLVSIIIPTHKRCPLLRKCLNSIQKAQNSYFSYEIIVCLNGEDPESSEYLKSQNEISFFQIEKTTPGQARNLAIKKAKGEFLCFLDDDVEVPSDYFSRAKEVLELNPGLDVFGGPDQTMPSVNFFEKAVGLSLKSPLTTFSTRYRHSQVKADASADEKKFILCNLWIKTELFHKEGVLFDSRFGRNEENILLYQLKEKGKKLIYLPSFFVYHKRKDGPLKLLRPVFFSGFFRAKSFSSYPKSFYWAYTLPSFFLLFILFSSLIPYAQFVLGTYLLLNFLTGFYFSTGLRNIHYLPLVMLINFLILMSYGCGFLKGILTKRFL